MQGKTTTVALVTAIAEAQQNARAAGSLVRDVQTKEGWSYASLDAIDSRAAPALAAAGLVLIFDGASTTRVGDCWFAKGQWSLVHKASGEMRQIPIELPFDPEDDVGERMTLNNMAKGAITGLERKLLLTLLRIHTRDPEGHEVPGPPRPGRRVVGTLEDPIPVDSVPIEEQVDTLVEQADRVDGVLDDAAAAPVIPFGATAPDGDGGALAELVPLADLSDLFRTARPAILRQCGRSSITFEEWAAVLLDCTVDDVPPEIPRGAAIKMESALEVMARAAREAEEEVA